MFDLRRRGIVSNRRDRVTGELAITVRRGRSVAVIHDEDMDDCGFTPPPSVQRVSGIARRNYEWRAAARSIRECSTVGHRFPQGVSLVRA